MHPFLSLYNPIPIRIEKLKHLPRHLLPLLLAHILGTLILEPVHAPDLVGRPAAVGIEIVKDEERRGVEVADVVFFGHVARWPVGGRGEGGLVMVAGVGEGEEGDGEDGGQECKHHRKGR